MFELMVDGRETVLDPDDVFDWAGLTMREAVRAVEDSGSSGPVLAGLDLMPPSLLTAVAVAGLDVGLLADPSDVVRFLTVKARLVAHHQAGLYEGMMAVLAEYERLDGGFDVETFRSATAELRACLRLTRNAANQELELASDLLDRLPTVLEALKRGRIDLRRARVLCQETAHLDEPQARMVCERVLERAENMTGPQLAALVRRLCVEIDPDSPRKRHDQAGKDRGVWSRLTETSTAEITAWGLCPVRVARVMNRVESIARHLATGSETRTLDQIRADIFLDLLEGNHSDTYRRGVTDIRVELTTLLNLDEKAVEIAGFGPVVKDVLARIDPDNRWQMVVTDQGQVIDTVVIRRRPTGPMRRQVEVRDQTCIFPGCRMPATNCDLDHRIPYAEGGLTHPDQLAPLCRYDHVTRHKAGWTHRRNPDGSHTWHSPLGATYTRPPP